MKKTNLLCLFLYLGILLGAPATTWAQNDYSVDFGTAGTDGLRDLWVDKNDGSVYFGGFSNTLKPLFGKLDDCGVLDGATEYNLSGWSQISSMVRADNGDFLLAGRYNNDWIVARVQADGTLIWAKSYDLTLERTLTIVKSTGDTYIFGGWYAQFGISDDATVVKIDGSGNQIWATRLNQSDDQTYELHSDGAGGVIVAGAIHGGGVNAFLARIDNLGNYAGGIRIDRTNNDFYEMTDVVKTSDGGYAVVGKSSLNQVGFNFRVLVVKKFDANFAIQWEKNYMINGSMGSSLQTILEDTDGNLYASGYSTVNGGSAVVLKLEGATGNLILSKAFPNTRFVLFQNEQGPTDHLVGALQILSGTSGGIDAGMVSMNDTLNSCAAVDFTPTLVNQPDVLSNWNVSTQSATFNVTDLTGLITTNNSQLSEAYICGGCCPEITVSADDCHEVFPALGPISTPANMYDCATLDASAVIGGLPPYTYSWTNGATTATTTVCPGTTTVYTVTVTDANGCTGSADFTVYATDVVDPNNNGNNVKVLICHNGNTLSVSINAVQAHIDHGDYVGNCNAIDPCTGMAKASVAETDKHDHDHANEISAYPNPFNETITVSYSLNSELNSSAAVVLYDLQGREVYRKAINTLAGQVILNPSLNSGTYLVSIINGDEQSAPMKITKF